MRSSLSVFKLPDQGRRCHKVLREIREAHLSDVRGIDHDLAINAPDLPTVVRQQGRLHRFETLAVVLVVPQHKCDLAADKLVEQLGRIQQVILIVLLQDAERRG